MWSWESGWLTRVSNVEAYLESGEANVFLL